MTAKLIKGTEIREEILEEITKEVAEIKAKHGVVPGLVTILVGSSPASVSYVTLKIQTAHRVGFHEVQDNQSPDIPEADLLALIGGYFKTPGRKIHAYRHRDELTQVRLAQRLGVSKQVVCDLEKDRRPITAATAKKLSEVFKTRLETWLA